MESRSARPSFRIQLLRRPVAAALALVTAVILGACGTDTVPDGSAGKGVSVVAPAEAFRIVNAADGRLVIVDVRTPEEFAAGHLAGATLIDYYASDFADKIGALDRNAQYVIYCRTGNRTEDARALMTDLGFTEVYDIEGGITAWKAAGYRVTTT